MIELRDFYAKGTKRLNLNSILQIQYRNKQDTIASFNGYGRENHFNQFG